jgi:hypothetical protein
MRLQFFCEATRALQSLPACISKENRIQVSFQNEQRAVNCMLVNFIGPTRVVLLNNISLGPPCMQMEFHLWVEVTFNDLPRSIRQKAEEEKEKAIKNMCMTGQAISTVGGGTTDDRQIYLAFSASNWVRSHPCHHLLRINTKALLKIVDTWTPYPYKVWSN